MNQFEKACNEIEDKVFDGGMVSENCIEWLRNEKQATVSFSQISFKNKVRKLKEKFPELIDICYEDDKVLVAHIPTSAIRLNIVMPREVSEEQKEILRNRMKSMREKKQQGKALETETVVSPDDNLDAQEENEEFWNDAGMCSYSKDGICEILEEECNGMKDAHTSGCPADIKSQDLNEEPEEYEDYNF